MSEALERYAVRRLRNDPSERAPEEETEDFGCFGWLRGVRERAVMLELRKRTGSIVAVSYSWLERADFDPSEGVVLHVGPQVIRIRGRNLNTEIRPAVRLFEGIVRHRVPWLAEVHPLESLPGSVEIAHIQA
jgi:hypothetical protein